MKTLLQQRTEGSRQPQQEGWDCCSVNIMVPAQVGGISRLYHGACHCLLEDDNLWETRVEL